MKLRKSKFSGLTLATIFLGSISLFISVWAQDTMTLPLNSGYYIEQSFAQPEVEGYCSNPTYTSPNACRNANSEWRYGHAGVDLNLMGSIDCGNPVYSIADGKVKYTQKLDSGWGHMTGKPGSGLDI